MGLRNSLKATAWPPQRTLQGASGSCEPKPSQAILRVCLSWAAASDGSPGVTAPAVVAGAGVLAAGAVVAAGAGVLAAGTGVFAGALVGAAGAPHAASNPSRINMSITVLRLDISLLLM